VGVLRALRAAGLDVPADVSVIGFDDVPWAEFIEPALTTVRQPLPALGSGAVEMLHLRIERPDDPPRYQTLEVELVARRSTAAVAPPGGRGEGGRQR
jgi:LacI family transcriptional regulator